MTEERKLPPAIEAAAREDPLVHVLGRMYLHGDLDYESFLEALVIEMAIRHGETQGQVLKLSRMQPVVVMLDKEQAKKLSDDSQPLKPMDPPKS